MHLKMCILICDFLCSGLGNFWWIVDDCTFAMEMMVVMMMMMKTTMTIMMTMKMTDGGHLHLCTASASGQNCTNPTSPHSLLVPLNSHQAGTQESHKYNRRANTYTNTREEQTHAQIQIQTGSYNTQKI